MLQFLKSKAYLLAALFLLLPSFASAHLKWFVNEEGELPSVPMEENTELYFIYWIIISAVIVLIGIFLEKRFPAIPKQIEYKLNSIKHKAASIFTIVIGLFLLIAAYKGFLFSDNLKNLGFLNSTLLGIETLVGFSFLLGLSVRVFSIVLIFLWTFGIAYVGLLNMFEAAWVLGAGIFALIYGREHFRITKLSGDLSNKFFLANEEYAFPVIRIITGIDLFILGISEKLARPELGLGFLNIYHWNFMQNLGFSWYSDYLFVLSAGFVESLLGLIFILGVVTRLNALATAIIFTIPLFLMGPVELIGHMPHFSLVLLLLIFGSGNKLKFIKSKNS